MEAPPAFDTSHFTNQPYVKRVEKPWGHELHWVREGAPYMGKLIHINAGHRLSMQVHDQKEETYFIVAGRGKVIWEDNSGELVETELQPGQGYSTQVGQRHRLAAITDCDIIEASTPEAGTTWRLDDDYARTKRPTSVKRSAGKGSLMQLPQRHNWVFAGGSQGGE